MGRSRPAQPVKRFTAEDAAGHRGGAGRVQRMCGGPDCLGGLAWRGAAGYNGWRRERMLASAGRAPPIEIGVCHAKPARSRLGGWHGRLVSAPNPPAEAGICSIKIRSHQGTKSQRERHFPRLWRRHGVASARYMRRAAGWAVAAGGWSVRCGAGLPGCGCGAGSGRGLRVPRSGKVW